MKIKLFTSHSCADLENNVNEFLETMYDENVIDIKYSSSDQWCEAMVIYHN